MVPPRASSDVPASRRLAVQDQTRGQKMAEQSTSAIDPAIENSPAEAKRPIPLEPVYEEVQLIEPEATWESPHVPMSSSLMPEEKKIETLKPIAMDESTKKIPAVLGTAETAQEKATEKKFFEKTVEIVDGQTAGPAEAHTILLREVKEWIAAGQNASEDVPADVADSAAEPLTDTMPSERQPGIVRIMEGRRSKAAPEVVQEVSTATLSEQNLELSIGTISVIVEGEERQPQSPPAPTARQPGASETPRRTSSLSRHYL